MANKSISMIQVRRIIQLKTDVFVLSKLKISELLHIHRTTLDNYLSTFEATGKSYPELLGYNDERLSALVFNQPISIVQPDHRIDDLKNHLDYFTM